MTIDKLIRPSIKDMKPYSSARDEYKGTSNHFAFLDANENPYNNGINRYPDPKQLELKEKLSQIKGIPAHQILLGNGSDEILDLILRVFCEPNLDNVITLPPTYGMYRVLANINAIELREIALSKNFQPRVNKVLEHVNKRTKLLLLCSPNNPTANSFNAIKVENLIRSFKGIVVIDEAYIDFSKEDSWLKRLSDFPNLIITQTLSKAYGMAGIRLGICYASTEIVNILNTIKPPYNINVLTQKKALERFSNIESIRSEIAHILKQRSYLFKALIDIKWISNMYPSDANFILVKVDNANLRYAQLIEKSIVVRNRTHQKHCENCLRITVGTKNENEKLIEALKTLK